MEELLRLENKLKGRVYNRKEQDVHFMCMLLAVANWVSHGRSVEVPNLKQIGINVQMDILSVKLNNITAY